MARTSRLAAVVLGALVTATGCAGSHDPGPGTGWPQSMTASKLAATPAGRLFSDPQGHYRLTIGDDWIALPSPDPDTSVVDPEEDIVELWALHKRDLGFHPTVNIFSEDATGIDLADYLENTHQVPYGNKFKIIKIVKSNDGRDVGYLDYTGDPRGTGPTHYMTVVDLEHNHAVVATLATDESDFQKYQPQIEPFLLTLQAT